jgi:hypothetical protein
MKSLKKSKKKNRKKKKLTKHTNISNNSMQEESLDSLLEKRVGGAINIRGIGFQLLYACYRTLLELDDSLPDKVIRLEGIEDVDIIQIEDSEYIQLKSSINNINANDFWKMGVLQNFLEVYKVNTNSKLLLVHNTKISKGNLNELILKNITQNGFTFWKEKFESSQIDISNVDFEQFINKVNFKKEDEKRIKQSCIRLLIERFEVNEGTEKQYLYALFNNIFFWSRDRSTIKLQDLRTIIQAVTDSFSKSPANPAIQYNWIKKIAFEHSDNKEDDSYFDGKAAKPIHIVQNLPVRRTSWENVIYDSINEFDVTLIKSSSGQGKSTLAWQVAKEFHDSDYSIYQLNYCNRQENIAGISDFIKTRLKIGELPIVIIDGVNNTISQWQILIEQIAELPVKVLVTSREEDWYRYGLDASKAHLKTIDIKLSVNEAKEIFSQLKSKGKIHSSIDKWEPVWEKIESKGLLIEYVFLLTRGQMIAERIQEQIKILNKEIGSSAKIEILRLISLADILNIKIQTKKLTEYVQDKIGFECDRGEIYKQLEREYYLQFNQKYIEGLHPVRSHHLVDTLHETLSVKDSLIILFQIIDKEFIYDYFIESPFILNKMGRQDFYNELAGIVSKYKFSEMVYAIDGLMHSEPYRYWIDNRKIFDKVFERGGIEIFVADTLPFTKLNTINNLNKSMGDKFPNLQYLSEKLLELSPYEINNSDLVFFAKSLAEQLNDRNQATDKYEGIGFLAKWFKQLDIPFPLILKFDEHQLIKFIDNSNINESSEVFNYFAISNSKAYTDFINTNKSKIISILKRETNSLTIEEKGKDIHIKYLLDENADKANEHSVYRIQTVYNFLPIYKRYCTKAIILPFPNEEIYKIVVQDSTKEMPIKNIADTFDIHINQIWNKTILDNYRSSSSFEWQEQYFQLRKEGIEFSKKCIRYFEATIEGNQNRIKSSTKPLVEQATFLSGLLKSKRKYPRQSKKYCDKEAFETEQKDINEWCSSLDNFINQFIGIIQPKTDNDRNVATINLRAVTYRLSAMQNSFDKIASLTFEYFPTEQIKETEQLWYNRLLRSVSFFINKIADSPAKKIAFAKTAVNNWWDEYITSRLQQVHSIIRNYEDESYFIFYLPNKIIEEESLKYVVIGVDKLDVDSIEEDLLELIGGLSEFSNTEIDFFTFVNIHDSEAIGAFRVQNDFFRRTKIALETGEFEESEFGIPIPINLDDSLLDSLEGITLKKIQIGQESESFIKMMFDIWKLSEYRKRLIPDNEIEKAWLHEIEKEYCENIEKYLIDIEKTMEENEYKSYKKLINDFMKNKLLLSKDEIINNLNKRVEKINVSIL